MPPPPILRGTIQICCCQSVRKFLILWRRWKSGGICVLRTHLKLRYKVKSYQFWDGSYSAFQPPFDPFNFPWSLGYIRKLAFGSPWGNYFTPGFVCSQHTAPRNIKLAQTQPSQSTSSHLGRVETLKFISCALRNSRKASVGFEPQTS